MEFPGKWLLPLLWDIRIFTPIENALAFMEVSIGAARLHGDKHVAPSE